MRAAHSEASVGFTRPLASSQAVALGLSVALGASVLAPLPLLLPMSGAQTPLVYLLAGLLALPVVLTWAERASVTGGGYSVYRAARAGGRLPSTFAAGWLKMGGYLALAAVLAQAVTDRLGVLAAEFLPQPPSRLLLAAGVVLLAAINELSGAAERWRSRSVLVWGAVAAFWLLAVLAIWDLEPQAGPRGREHADHWLGQVAPLLGGLWSLDLILTQRGRLRKPRQRTPWTLSAAWLLAMLMGAVLAVLALRFPGVLAPQLGPEAAPSRLELLAFLFGLMVAWAGLARTLSAAIRLRRAMSADGLLPGGAGAAWLFEGRAANLVGFAAVVVPVALLVPTLPLLGFSAFGFLVTTALVMLAYASSGREAVGPRFRLPLHPLFPMLSGIGSLFFLLVLPPASLGAGAAWLTVGLVHFLLYARRRGTLARREEAVVGDRSAPPEETLPRILVAGGDGELSASLIRAAAALARGRGGELLVLETVASNEQTPSVEARRMAEGVWTKLSERVAEIVPEDLRVLPLVRIAGGESAAILETSSEYDVETIVLALTPRPSRRGREPEVSRRVFQATSRPLLALRGEPAAVLRRVLVATAGGPHAPVALRLGSALAGDEGTVTLLSVASGQQDVERAEQAVVETLAAVPDVGPVEAQVVTSSEPVARVIQKQAEGYDLVLIGAAVDRLLGQAVEGGVHDAVSEAPGLATGLVKRAERARHFWLRRLWHLASHPLPVLPAPERAEVFATMRDSARADVDYYVLMSLASVIATAGLVLNSGAVIIGAMLVAPLMSPILATGHGVVLGSLLLVRRAGISTLKGVSVAVGFGTLLGILLPQAPPTNEILARAEPNLLDLTVAVAAGAAAAYAVCRKSVAAALPGVAISVALVPPLCVAGWGIGQSRFDIAGGAMVLFLTNLSAIVLVGALVFLLMGIRPLRVERGATVRLALVIVGMVILGLMVPLGLTTVRSLRTARIELQMQSLLEREGASMSVTVRDVVVRTEGGEYVVRAVVHYQGELDVDSVHRFRRRLEERSGLPIRLELTYLQGLVVESSARAPGE